MGKEDFLLCLLFDLFWELMAYVIWTIVWEAHLNFIINYLIWRIFNDVLFVEMKFNDVWFHTFDVTAITLLTQHNEITKPINDRIHVLTIWKSRASCKQLSGLWVHLQLNFVSFANLTCGENDLFIIKIFALRSFVFWNCRN